MMKISPEYVDKMKNFCFTPSGGHILPILQFSLQHEHCRYVTWTKSGFEA